MITEDYILRLIRLGAEFIAKALGLSKEGDFLRSEAVMENGLQDLTGLSLDTLKKIEAEALRTIVAGDEASIYILARFLETLAEVEKQKGIFDMYFIYLKKALELYLFIENEDVETAEPINRLFETAGDTIYDRHLLAKLKTHFEKKGNHEKASEVNDIISKSPYMQIAEN